MEITTETGFTCKFNPEVLDDMELLEDLQSVIKENDVIAIANVLTRLIGKDQKKALYDHVRTEDGRVPISRISNEIGNILNLAGNAGKNS